ncbi:MAG: MFS transporter [Bacillota bacterium]|nr:MFS transporter [Bacillota bacterium]
MGKTFASYKWISLMAFALMYNLVYLGRFNVNNLMDNFAGELSFSAGQQDMISLSVFASYAVGSFINGYLADRFGAKKIVIIGGTVSAILNMCVAFQNSWVAILVLWLVNGYFQSMIWVGGISLLANWWKEGERGKGVGIANFFSGMSHATAYLLPIMIMSLWPTLGWRSSLVIPMIPLMIFVILFGIFAVERPQRKGLEPYGIDDKRHQERERQLERIAADKGTPWKYFFSQKKFWWWCIIAMLSSICRYGLLNWIPLYYSEEKGTAILNETFSSLTLPVGMAFGTLIITWIAGTKLFNNKGLIVIAMAAICATLVVLFPMIGDTRSVLVGIFFTGFALYGINGILWVHAIDQGCRVFAGSAAGVFNGFAYLGAFLESFLFTAVVDIFGNYLAVFIVMEVLCIFMAICGMIVSKKNTVIVPEVQE